MLGLVPVSLLPPQLVQDATNKGSGPGGGSANIWRVSRGRRGSPSVCVPDVHLLEGWQRLLQGLESLQGEIRAVEVQFSQTLDGCWEKKLVQALYDMGSYKIRIRIHICTIWVLIK